MTTAQSPINSGFSRASTTVDVIKSVDLVGKVAIVTGGYSGLGLETARTLASAGTRVIVPARDVERARKAIAEAGGGMDVQFMDSPTLARSTFLRATSSKRASHFTCSSTMPGSWRSRS